MGSTATPGWRDLMVLSRETERLALEEARQPHLQVIRETRTRVAEWLMAHGIDMRAIRLDDSRLTTLGSFTFEILVSNSAGQRVTVTVNFNPDPKGKSNFTVDGTVPFVWDHSLGSTRAAAKKLQQQVLNIPVSRREVGGTVDWIVDVVLTAWSQARQQQLATDCGEGATLDQIGDALAAEWWKNAPLRRMAVGLPEGLGATASLYQLRISAFPDPNKESQICIVETGTDKVLSDFFGFRPGYFGSLTAAALECANALTPILKRPVTAPHPASSPSDLAASAAAPA